ncbi:MAG TPA: outer membrane beta-barrel protein [Xanthobacteraceae bacterium]|nr:outer membrane beta-barrel protein [Xanthobacteraceae bacterium]
MAADLPVKARGPAIVPIQEMNWTGLYLGVFGGYHDGDITQSGCVGLCAVDPHLRGALFGVQAGYDYEFSNRVVLGVLGWVPLTRPRETISIGPGLDFHVRPRFAAVVAGRLGFAFDHWLPYVMGGVGFADVRVRSDVTGLEPSNHYTGAVVGAGVEYAFTRNISLDLRYMYSNAPKKTYDFGGGLEKYGENASNVTLGLNYRF